ncbi:ribonuclease HII [candidate division WWE3 bacterium]|jgi:ribonuclease HII|uniref:Ribonuclease HII n=1 Tax=candidate division WWE3 bacterium TaxID=2053526 RepID=A0A3A4ZAI1_UNCKA|nr:MAG: ribonuclease HII [candidate division WWE3 bacterium]
MDLLKFEKELYNKGVRKIAGVDEVGRGSIAGPIVAAAVILDLEYIIDTLDNEDEYRNNDIVYKKHTIYDQINDSKLITPGKRSILDEFLRIESVCYSIDNISNEEIDKLGIGVANKQVLYDAVLKLELKPDYVLVDHFKIPMFDVSRQTSIKRGDALSISIAAASILAKVYRDNLMNDMHTKFPQYGFHKNKGYGTRQHFESLFNLGPCPIHRKSFEPVKSITTSTI